MKTIHPKATRMALLNIPLRSIAIALAVHFVFVLSANARTVSLEEAKNKAQRFLYQNSKSPNAQARSISASTLKLAYEARTTDKRVACFYVLNQPSSQGYIIMSADDRLPEVLGYSDSGEFDINKIPDNMKWWLSEYERQIEQVLASSDNGVMPIAETSFRDGWTEIEPLVKTKWNQETPYNNLCPPINGEKAPTGCVATAMAQIMKYYQWPTKGRGSHSYTWNGQTLSMDFSEMTFDWDNMLDTYIETPEYNSNETITDEQYLSFTDMELNIENDYYLIISSLSIIGDNKLEGNIQLLLTDNNGNFIRPVGQGKIFNLSPGYYYETYNITYSIPGDISDGLYRLYLGFKFNGSTEWSMAKSSTSEENYITVSKAGAFYTIEDNTYACSYSEAQGNIIASLMYACGISVNMNYTRWRN